ncbi:MAG: hypothetical protein V8S20_07315 [Candidatus Gastranaerophilaceae bacterium]|jgi:septin family protein|nr:unknown [Fusobacterium sp. CAG:815]
MGILIFTARVHDLIYQKSNIEYRLTKLTKKLRDMQQYAATVGNGSVSIGDLLNSPGSMMGRTMNYLSFAHNSSMQYMQQNLPLMQQMYQQQMAQQQNPQQQQMMQNYMMKMLYMQGRDRAAQIEAKNLNMEEQRIAQEKEKLETQLAEVNQELKSAKEARDQGIKDMAPKYVA